MTTKTTLWKKTFSHRICSRKMYVNDKTARAWKCTRSSADQSLRTFVIIGFIWQGELSVTWNILTEPYKSRTKQGWCDLEEVNNQVQFCFQLSIRLTFFDSHYIIQKTFSQYLWEKISYSWPEQNSKWLCKYRGGSGGYETLYWGTRGAGLWSQSTLRGTGKFDCRVK